MRIQYPSVQKLLYEDRAGITQVFTFLQQNVAPHLPATRFSYTVPAGRWALVETVDGYVRRNSIATDLSYATIRLILTISGVGSYILWQTYLYSNAIADHSARVPHGGILLEQGQTIAGETEDASTGGSCDYWLIVKLTEFDRL